MNNTNEQVKQEQVESKAKKFSKKAMIMTGIALTGVAAVAIKVISSKNKDAEIEVEREVSAVPDVNNMNEREYIEHLHNIEVIPDEVMNYIEGIEQENELLRVEVEELSIDKQELKETILFLEDDIADLEAEILGHEK